jgi:hypothetical protein
MFTFKKKHTSEHPHIKCIEFTACAYNFKDLAVESTMKKLKKKYKRKRKKRGGVTRAVFCSAY